MSYDFELFAATAASLANLPDVSAGIINVDGPNRVEGEDIPESFHPFVGTKRWLCRIHLEGSISAVDRPVINVWLREIIVA